MAKQRRKPRADEIERIPREQVHFYLRTGVHEDHPYGEWPGRDFFDQAQLGNEVLRTALIEEVRHRAGVVKVPEILQELDVQAFTRNKIDPMVRGLFPKKEQEAMLQLLQRSVIFLTPRNIEDLLLDMAFHHSAWTLANLYLLSVHARPLGDEDALGILGMSEATTCYVTMRYFDPEERTPFEDFVVHECAHVFHNWKREHCGLPFTRRKEWLLQIAFVRRETFAYACEAFSRILALEGSRKSPARRRALLDEHLAASRNFPGSSERVDHDEYRTILREAVSAQNGWKRILRGCAEHR